MILLLHGALGSQDQFKQAIALLPPDCQVLTMNFHGHGGRSDEGRSFDMEEFVADVLQLMAEKGLAKVDVFGYSMGGYVAMILAKNHPEKVGAICTLGTKLDWTPDGAAKEVKMLNPDVIAAKVPKFAAMLEARHAPEDWRQVLHKTADMMLGLGNGNALSLTDFQSISHRIHICLGELDHMVTEAESREVAEGLPNGSFELLPGVKHPIEQVKAEVLVDLIRKCNP